MSLKINLTITLAFIFCFGRLHAQSQRNDDIARFIKVWGFLKYYHPAINDKADLDKEFIDKLDQLESSIDKSAFYINWVKNMGEMKRCNNCTESPNKKLITNNFNLNWLKDSVHFSKELREVLNNVFLNRKLGNKYYARINGRAGNSVEFTNELPYKDSVFPSLNMRLLTLSRFWNMIEYFFPDKYLIGESWDSVLQKAIPEFMGAKNIKEYTFCIASLISNLHDNHAVFYNAYIANYIGLKTPPFNTKLIGNRIVVTDVYNDTLFKKTGMRIGDVITRINNQDALKVAKEKSKYISFSNEWSALHLAARLALKSNNDSVLVEYERDNNAYTTTIKLYPSDKLNFNVGKKRPLDILEGNIGYIKLENVKDDEIDSIAEQIRQTSGLIIDARNYITCNFTKFVNRLSKEAKPAVLWSQPNIDLPGTFEYSMTFNAGKSNKDYYKNPIVILCDETNQSYSETCVMNLQALQNAVTVGSQTAGANGNVVDIILPGNYKTRFSGLGCFYPDLTPVQRVGVKIDYVIHSTIQNLINGKDDLIIKAIEMIMKANHMTNQ